MMSACMCLFLFQVVFMDAAATIPTGAMAERWKFVPFCVWGLFCSMLLYPIFGNWVWGGGWLSQLGTNFGLGHGYIDFAGFHGGACRRRHRQSRRRDRAGGAHRQVPQGRHAGGHSRT